MPTQLQSRTSVVLYHAMDVKGFSGVNFTRVSLKGNFIWCRIARQDASIDHSLIIGNYLERNAFLTLVWTSQFVFIFLLKTLYQNIIFRTDIIPQMDFFHSMLSSLMNNETLFLWLIGQPHHHHCSHCYFCVCVWPGKPHKALWED